MRHLNEWAGRQPSIFDGKQRMDENFVPLPGRPVHPLLKKTATNVEPAQLF
jgi:hypothetical protein